MHAEILMMGTKDIIVRYLILFSSHLFSILTPLVIFPILVSRLGEAGFGKVLLIQSIITYFAVLVDYDFNLWGVRELARGSSLRETYSEVTQSKLFLAFISSLLYLILCLFLFEKFESWPLVLSGLVVIISYVFNPLWFFQGQEKIWSMAAVNILSKLLFLAGSFYFVSSMESAWVYNLAIGSGILLPGLWVFVRHYRNNVQKPEFKRGLDIFYSNFSILLYSNSSPFWIGLFLPVSSVTEFSVAERLIFAARGFMSLYAQIIYPKICQEKNSSDHVSLVRSHLLFTSMTFIGGLVCATYAQRITNFFLQGPNSEVAQIVRVMSLLPTLIVCNVFAYQWLLAHSYYSYTRKVLVSGALMGLLLFPLGIYKFQLWGAVFASFIVEFFISVALILSYFRLRKSHVPARQ